MCLLFFDSIQTLLELVQPTNSSTMSVEVGLKDCRSDAVPVHRQKEKKVRYRNVNAALIGTPRGVRDRNQAVWTEKNK